MKIKILTDKIKKTTAVTLAGVMVLFCANTIPAQAQDISQVSVSKPGYGITRTESGSGVNVRNASNLNNSEIIFSIPNNTRLMIVGTENDFYKVQYDAYGNYGYVLKSLLDFFPTSHYLVANTSSNNLNMRQSNSVDSKIIASIPKGTAFAYWVKQIEWFRGIYGNQFGCTSKDYTKLCDY